MTKEDNDYNMHASYLPEEGIVMEGHSDAMCLVDPDNYEVLYANKNMIKMFNLPDDYVGKKCYELLYKSDTKCENCFFDNNNDIDVSVKSIEYNSQETKVIFKEKLCTWQGKKVKLVSVTNISDDDSLSDALTRGYDLESTLKKCIDEVSGGDSTQDSITNMLKIIGQYYDAARVIQFECDEDRNIIAAKEWLKNGSLEKRMYNIDNIQEALSDNAFKTYANDDGVLFVENLSKVADKNKKYLNQGDGTKAESVMVMKLEKNSQVKGYVCVINPTKHTYELTILISICTYIANELVRHQLWSQRTYELTHDKLTGSYNRTSYVEYINEIKDADSLGYVCVDIDGLGNINEDIGYDHGDLVLKDIARRLRTIFVGYPVFRFESDDFIVCCVDVERDEFAKLCNDAKQELAKANQSASMGYVWDDFDINPKKMNEHAKQLLKIEKRKSIESAKYYKKQGHDTVAKGILGHLNNNEFKVYLQPKINMNDGSLCGAEALIRLEHPEYGLVAPGKFIPMLERSATIHLVDLFVFESVCKMLEEMKKNNKKLFPVSFNFSKMTLLESDLTDRMEEILSRYDVPRQYLEIEITETIGDMENDLITKIANSLHDKGFRLSMDDFGTKYSSISTLSLMKFDILKIDRSMVNNLTESQISRKVLKHVIKMCKDIGIECIAEGVENENQISILKDVECYVAQGYYYSKPIPKKEFIEKFVA